MSRKTRVEAEIEVETAFSAPAADVEDEEDEEEDDFPYSNETFSNTISPTEYGAARAMSVRGFLGTILLAIVGWDERRRGAASVAVLAAAMVRVALLLLRSLPFLEGAKDDDTEGDVTVDESEGGLVAEEEEEEEDVEAEL